jgi:hypothetical protein
MLERDVNAMRFRAKYVCASENGDYYQVAFENTDPAGDAADVDVPAKRVNEALLRERA